MLATGTATRLATGLLAASALVLASCGGSDDDGNAGQPAPEASSFPAADGRSLEQVLSEADAEGPVVSPAGQVYRKGDNRYAFGVFTTGREEISGAEGGRQADRMEDDDVADVLGKEPVVLTFAPPALCQSGVCGPTVDIAEEVKSK